MQRQSAERHRLARLERHGDAIAGRLDGQMPGCARGLVIEQAELVAAGHNPDAAVAFVHVVERAPDGDVCRHGVAAVTVVLMPWKLGGLEVRVGQLRDELVEEPAHRRPDDLSHGGDVSASQVNLPQRLGVVGELVAKDGGCLVREHCFPVRERVLHVTTEAALLDAKRFELAIIECSSEQNEAVLPVRGELRVHK